MAEQDKGLDQQRFCALTEVTENDLLKFCREDYPLLPGLHLPEELRRGKMLTYADALAIFVARQFGDDWGIPLDQALRLTSHAGSIEGFLDYQPAVGTRNRTLSDFWSAIIQIVVANKDHAKSGIGPKEYRVAGHYTGPLHQISAEITHRLSTDEDCFDGEPTRILLVNVSAADRRLRKWAEGLGIGIVGFEFEAEHAE